MKNTFSLNQRYPFLMGVIFFKAFPGISNVSQNGINKLFTIIKHQFDGSVIDSKTGNLSYCIMGFFFKPFHDISHISQNSLKKLFIIIKQQFYGSKVDSEESSHSFLMC